MRRAYWTSVLPVVVLGFTFAANADTLQLKNGTVVQGRFVGGSERAVVFEVSGSAKQYPVSDVLSVTFTTAPPSSADSVSTAPVATPAPTAPAPAAAVAASPAPPAPPPTPAASITPRNSQDDAASGNASGSPRTSTSAATSNSPASITVPAGSRIMVRMIDSVDSKTNRVGDKFRASLEQDLIANGVTIAPKGADVYGRLAEVREAGRVTGKAQLTLELTDLTIHNRLQPIVTGEYEMAGDSRSASTAKRAGGGAAIGAVIGAIAGGGKGAAIGAGVGAGAGTATNAAREADQVNVPSETLLEFRLSQPFTPQLN